MGWNDVASAPAITPRTFVPSPQQQDVFDFVQHERGSAIIEAVAGAGKTTTLVEVCKLIAGSGANAVFTAFNKKISDEIGHKLSACGIGWKQVKSATFHSLGFAAWKRVAGPHVKVNENKMYQILVNMSDEECPPQYRSFVIALVSLAKQSLVGVLYSPENDAVWYDIVDYHDLADRLDEVYDQNRVSRGITIAKEALARSIDRDMEEVDFNDMIYAPLVHDVNFWQYDYVLVDEAQDTNAARRAFAKKILKPGGRLLAVGDPHQAIYGFTGADSDALDLIEEEFGCVRLPLTVTYRCPKKVVNVARTWVSHITAHESAPDGVVDLMNYDEFMRQSPDFYTREDAVLCRNTKPLVQMAFSLIRRRIPCHVEGRDIGVGLIKLCTRWKAPRTVGELREKLEKHLAEQSERLLAKMQEQKLQTLVDQIETIFTFMESLDEGDPIDDLTVEITKVFADSPAPGITLSTIHKAKGREWDRVFWLGRHRYQPSKYARQEWQHQQELNLMYVAATRSKSILIDIEVPVEI